MQQQTVEHMPPSFPETVEMVRLASHEQVRQQTVEHVPPNFPVTVEVVSVAPHEQVQQQTTPVPLIEHVTSSVNEFIAPAPPVTFSTPSQQFPVYAVAAVTTGASLDTTSFVHSPCLVTDVEASASHVVGSLPPLGEFTAPVHQERTVAKQKRVQQHTAEEIIHVPIPQIQEQIVEGVKEIPPERSPEQTVKQIKNATPIPVVEDVTPEPGFSCTSTVPVVEYVAPPPVIAPSPEELSALESVQNIIHERRVDVDRCVRVPKRETEKLPLLEECSFVRELEELRDVTSKLVRTLWLPQCVTCMRVENSLGYGSADVSRILTQRFRGLWTVYEMATACPGQYISTGHTRRGCLLRPYSPRVTSPYSPRV